MGRPVAGADLDLVVAVSTGGPVAEEWLRSIDWRTARSLSAAHRVDGLMWRFLQERKPAGCPRDVLDEFERSHAAQVFDYLGKAAETVRIVSVLADRGVRSIVLKGCAVAQQYYQPTPAVKYSNDIDILVAAEDFAAADQALAQAGYARVSPSPDLPPVALQIAQHLGKHFEYTHSTSGHLVELHHRLLADAGALTLEFEDLLVRSVEVRIGNGTIRSLGPVDCLLYLTCHGAAHAYARLKWLADVAQVVRQLEPAQLEQAFALAKSTRCSRPFLLSLLTLERSGGPARPATVRECGERVEHLLPAIERGIRRGLSYGRLELRDVPDHVRDHLLGFRLAQSWRSRASKALAFLVNIDDVRILRLGVGWIWAYALLGWPLALFRYMRRVTFGRKQPESA